MNEEKLRSIAVKDFSGDDFYVSTYRGLPYLTEIKEERLWLYSQELLEQKSINEGDIFATKIKIEDLSGVSHNKLYATYRNIEFEVLNVEKGLERLTLKGREDHVTEDIGLGFDYKRLSEDQFNKQVKFKELDDIRIVSEDVYKEFDDKYGHKPYNFSAPYKSKSIYTAGGITALTIILYIGKVIAGYADYEMKIARERNPIVPAISEQTYYSSYNSYSNSSETSSTAETSVSESENASEADEDDAYAKVSQLMIDHKFDTEGYLEEYEELLENCKVFFEKHDPDDYDNPEVYEQYSDLCSGRHARMYFAFYFRDELSDDYYADFTKRCTEIEDELDDMWEYSNKAGQ